MNRFEIFGQDCLVQNLYFNHTIDIYPNEHLNFFGGGRKFLLVGWETFLRVQNIFGGAYSSSMVIAGTRL